MKILLTTLFFTLSNALLFAQTNFENYTIAQLDSLAELAIKNSNFEQAINYKKVTIEKALALSGEEDSLVAAKIHELSNIYFSRGYYVIAQEYCEKALAIRKKVLGETHKDYLASWSNLIAFLYYNGKLKEAIVSNEKLLLVYERKYGNGHLAYSECLRKLATLNMEMGRYPLAEKQFEKVLKIQKKKLGEADVNYFATLNNIAILKEYMGSYKEAEQLHLQIIEGRKNTLGEESVEYSGSLQNLAILYGETGKLEAAEPLYKKTLDILKKKLGVEHPEYATNLGNFAGLYISIGKYELAELLLLESKDIYEKKYGKEHVKYGGIMINLADLYWNKGDLEKTIQTYDMALANLENHKEHQFYRTLLANLGSTYKAEKKYDKSIEIYQSLLAIYKKEKNDLKCSFVLNLLGRCYIEKKEFDKAEKTLTEALMVRGSLENGERSYRYIDILTNIIYLYKESREYEKAVEYVKKGYRLVIPVDSLGISSLGEIESYLKSVDYELSFANSRRIIRFLDEVGIWSELQYDSLQDVTFLQNASICNTVILKLNNKRQKSFSNKKDKMELAKKTASYTPQAIRVELAMADASNDFSHIDKAFAYAEKNKSTQLTSALQKSTAYQLTDMPDSLMHKEKELAKKLDELKKQNIDAQSDKERTANVIEQRKVNEEIEAFLAMLKSKYPEYYQIQYKASEVSIKNIQEQLDEQTLFLEYYITESKTYLFAITKDSVQVLPIKLTKSKIKEKVKNLRKALSDYGFIQNESKKAYQLYTREAYWFYNQLLAPVLANRKEINKLVIVPDNELGHLPFEAFLTKVARQNINYKNLDFLLNTYQVSYSYSAEIWQKNKTKTKKETNGKILACAAQYDRNVVLESSLRTPYLIDLRKQLNPLPAAEQEVNILAKNFGGDFWLAADCNEKRFKAEAKDYSIIHLAMHGILNKTTPMLSSLVFTENKDSLEDNFLEAHEITHLQLNSELVVLSACETGYGRFEQGEGVLSLARSFMYAGTPSLVVSLWQVNDYSTSLLMQSFYENLATGMTKSAALQQAKLAIINSENKTFAHPAFWSPFIQLGDDRPVYIKHKSSLGCWIVGGVFVLGLLFLGYKRSRIKESA